MEFNKEELHEKIRPALEAIIGLTNSIDPVTSPVAAAVQSDVHLGMFLVFAMDFVGATPTAVISGDAVEHLENGEVRMVLPIPQMFESYYTMRMAKMGRNQAIGPDDQIVTPISVSTDGKNVVIALEKTDGE